MGSCFLLLFSEGTIDLPALLKTQGMANKHLRSVLSPAKTDRNILHLASICLNPRVLLAPSWYQMFPRLTLCDEPPPFGNGTFCQLVYCNNLLFWELLLLFAYSVLVWVL